MTWVVSRVCTAARDAVHHASSAEVRYTVGGAVGGGAVDGSVGGAVYAAISLAVGGPAEVESTIWSQLEAYMPRAP